MLSNRSKNKLLVVLHGVLRRAMKVWGLPVNPAAGIERYPQRSSGHIDVLDPEEVWALVRAAESDQDAAVFLTAAFTGSRRGELLALRWRDIDFVNHAIRVSSEVGQGAIGAVGRTRRARSQHGRQPHDAGQRASSARRGDEHGLSSSVRERVDLWRL